MATTVKSTSVVEVTLVDSALNEQTFNLDNPKSGLTLASVQSAFGELISLNDSDTGEIFCSRFEFPFRSIKEALTVETTKRTTVLE